MGSYKCPICNILRPKSHEQWHWDGGSYTCPVLRDEIDKARAKENWKRLRKLSEMAEEYFS